MNVYGWWEYKDDDPLEIDTHRIYKGDIINGHSRRSEQVFCFFKGNYISLRIEQLKKFKRPIRGHKPSTCLTKGMFGSDCKKCDVWVKKKNCITTR